MAAARALPHVAIVPGNGCTNIMRSNWYGWLATELRELGFSVSIENMPDPHVARRSVWIPFMRETLQCGENTIIVGHSSGAVAAMRFMEEHRVRGSVLVSACVTDLGDSNERASGYYKDPWNWEAMKANSEFVTLYGSGSDPFIPLSEQQQVADGLGIEITNIAGRGHFMEDTMPEVLAQLAALTSTPSDASSSAASEL